MKQQTTGMKLTIFAMALGLLTGCGQGMQSLGAGGRVTASAIEDGPASLTGLEQALDEAQTESIGKVEGAENWTDDQVLKHLEDRLKEQIKKIETRLLELEEAGTKPPADLAIRGEDILKNLNEQLAKLSSDAAFRKSAIERERKLLTGSVELRQPSLDERCKILKQMLSNVDFAKAPAQLKERLQASYDKDCSK